MSFFEGDIGRKNGKETREFFPVVTGTVMLAIGLNLIIPKDKEDHAAEQAAAEVAALKAQKLADQDGQK